jgi:hypothetical protein
LRFKISKDINEKTETILQQIKEAQDIHELIIKIVKSFKN